MEQTQINTQALDWQTRCTADEYLEFFGGRKQSQERAITGWTKPEVGILKINSDGSYNKDTLTRGWGYIIRDHEGDVVVTAAGRLHHVHDALQVEAEACIRAIYKAQELGIGNVVMETYASTLVSAIKTSRYDLAPNGNLFQEIKAFASLNFISFDIVHCPRACNKVADALAMHGSKMVLASQAVRAGGANVSCCGDGQDLGLVLGQTSLGPGRWSVPRDVGGGGVCNVDAQVATPDGGPHGWLSGGLMAVVMAFLLVVWVTRGVAVGGLGVLAVIDSEDAPIQN
ncbi:hypothetical protein D1007_42402 [Hordeum vulgare]|nr:hypothetical protein D1007_42402 [Hordeum vulgare]